MALASVVDKIEDVPEAIREDYVQSQDGKFRLKLLDGFESADSVKGLKSALQKERDNAAKAARDAAALAEQFKGIDPDKIKAWESAQASAQEDAAKKAGEWDALKKQLTESQAKDIAKKDAEIARRDAAISALMIDGEAARVVADEKGNATLLMPHIKMLTRVQPDANGNPRVVVVDEQGQPRINGKGDPMTIKELVAEMRTKEVFAGAFAGSGNAGGAGSAGGGSPPGSGNGNGSGNGGGPAAGKARSKMTITEKAAFIKANGTDKYMELPA